MSDVNLEDKNKEELLEIAREQDLEGRSSMNKADLVEALGNQGDGSVSEGGTEVRDAEDLLTPTGPGTENDQAESEGAQERLDTVKEVSPVAADLVAEELDFQGPLHIQDPRERVMTGAVSEEQAKEQEELLANKPDDFIGDTTEAGFDTEGNHITAKRLPEVVSEESDEDSVDSEDQD